MDGWRPEYPEEAVLSACSSMITVIDDQGSKTVHFFTIFGWRVQYMTSDRLQTLDIGRVCDYYIHLEPAHTLLARASIAALLQLDENVDRERVARHFL